MHSGKKKASGVIEDVALGKSELGILYLSDSNRNFILKNLNANNLEFHHLTECSAFVYLHKNHPLAKKRKPLSGRFIRLSFCNF